MRGPYRCTLGFCPKYLSCVFAGKTTSKQEYHKKCNGIRGAFVSDEHLKSNYKTTNFGLHGLKTQQAKAQHLAWQCTATTLGTLNLWPLLKEVAIQRKFYNIKLRIGPQIGRYWSLFGGGHYLRLDCYPCYPFFFC